MNPSTQVVSPLRQRMIEDMRLRKLNGKTQIAYVRAVRRLAGFLRRSPDTARGRICGDFNCTWLIRALRR
jgi:hypothetical protein